MANFTKWLGAGLGWTLGGPIGGILGYVLGSFVDGFSEVDLRNINQSTRPSRAPILPRAGF